MGSRGGVKILVAMGVLGWGCKEPSQIDPAPRSPVSLPRSGVLEMHGRTSAGMEVSQREDTVWIPGVRLVVPKGWRVRDSSDGNRVASLVTPEGFVFGVHWFGRSGASVDDSLETWKCSFGKLEVDQMERDPIRQPGWVIGRLRGEYLGGAGSVGVVNPSSQELLVGVVPGEKGLVFFKGIGTPEQASPIYSQFRQMIQQAITL